MGSIFGVPVFVSEFLPPDAMAFVGRNMVIMRGIGRDELLSTADGWALIYRARLGLPLLPALPECFTQAVRPARHPVAEPKESTGGE